MGPDDLPLDSDIAKVIYACGALTREIHAEFVVVKSSTMISLLGSVPMSEMRRIFRTMIPSPPPLQGELLALWLRVARDVLGQSQGDLATTSGLDRKVISQLETNTKASVRTDTLQEAIENIVGALQENEEQEAA
jgi:hypothetical protein